MPLLTGAAPAPEVTFVTGGYAREGNAGVLPLGYQPGAERWRVGTPTADARNASFGVVHPRLGLLYVVEEATAGSIAVLRRGAAGQWATIARFSSLGADPCHLALHPAHSFLTVANYSSGSVALFRLDPASGLPVGPGERRTHQGHGPNKARQDSAHAHWVGFSPDGRWLHAVDLGADMVFAHRFDSRTGTLGEVTMAFEAEPGSGPRQTVRHPFLPRAYLINELASSVTTLRTDDDAHFANLGSISTLPPGFAGRNTAAEIAVNQNGTWLYASNRGADDLAVFEIAGGGALRLMQHVPSGGRTPRHFLLIERERCVVVPMRAVVE